MVPQTLDMYIAEGEEKELSLPNESLVKRLKLPDEVIYDFISYVEKHRDNLALKDLANKLGVHLTLIIPILEDLIKYGLLELDEYVTFYILRRIEHGGA